MVGNDDVNNLLKDCSAISGMGSISKAFDIINAIVSSRDGLTQHEIAQKTKIPLSTAKRIIHGLHMRGVLIQLGKGKSYFVNSTLFCNRSICLHEHGITELVAFLDDFYEKFHLVASVYCRNGHDGFALYRKGGGSPVVEYSPEGLLLPLGSLVPTFGILAAMDQVEAHTVLEANRERIAGFEVHSIEYVHNLVNIMREQGYLHVQGAWNPGRSHAVFPLLLTNGCEAALSVLVERNGDYTRHLQDATVYIQNFVSNRCCGQAT